MTDHRPSGCSDMTALKGWIIDAISALVLFAVVVTGSAIIALAGLVVGIPVFTILAVSHLTCAIWQEFSWGKS